VKFDSSAVFPSSPQREHVEASLHNLIYFVCVVGVCWVLFLGGFVFFFFCWVCCVCLGFFLVVVVFFVLLFLAFSESFIFSVLDH